jgi:hypothetical protein
VSATIRLSLRAARTVIYWRPGVDARGAEDFAFRELEAAIAKALRASATRAQLRKPKVAKRKAKKHAWGQVRDAVVARAANRCEACTGWLVGLAQVDHFFGRSRAETVETCWALCRQCHEEKTINRPSAASWLIAFAKHCAKHGYSEAEARARKRLAFVQARGAP